MILVGNLGKDPEIQSFDNGVKKASFSMATTESYKGKDGNKVDTTEWHNIVLWRTLAETAEKWLKKGQQIYLEGKIKTRSYDDKDGNKRYITEIVGDSFTMLGGPRREGDNNAHAQPVVDAEAVSAPQPDDDLPF